MGFKPLYDRVLVARVEEDEKTAGLSDTALRIYVSTFVLADDHGNLRASSKFIEKQVFWSRDPAVPFPAGPDQNAHSRIHSHSQSQQNTNTDIHPDPFSACSHKHANQNTITQSNSHIYSHRNRNTG